MLGIFGGVDIGLGGPAAAVLALELGFGNALHQIVVAVAIGDEIADRADLEPVLGGEALAVRARDGLPMREVAHEDARADHVVETSGPLDAAILGDGYFQFGARHSGKCMDIKGGSTANGTNAIQFSCGSGNNQRFRLLPYGDGYFAIQAKHSNQCLDIAGAVTGDGGFLIQWPCAWTDNEKFRFKP